MGERVYIGLGANLGDRAAALRAALAALRSTPGVLVKAVSPLYESDPVGPVLEQPAFLNAVAVLVCDLGPRALLDRLLDIEAAAGRMRTGPPGGPRSLDLDLLLYEVRVLRDLGLIVPHPRLGERAFVLRPLLDLEPGLVHPATGERLANLAARVADQRCIRLDLLL